MAEEARELLIYGVAAAQANSRDEARNYLEWVLRIDADYDQQADAWYWLSYITDDPKEKRDCLETVLALNPRYPEALRDMALLDGRLKKSDMHDPRFQVGPIAPDSNLSGEETHSYKCPRCGARMTARGPSNELSCGFCGYRPGVDKVENVLQGLDEQDWVAAIYAVKGQRWELPTERAFKCAACGASVILPPSHVSILCPFCGVPYVAQAAIEQELIEPNGVAPFTFGAGEAFAYVARWLQKQRFAPGDLPTHSQQVPPHPIYLPFWTFDIDGEVSWHGWEVSTKNGKPAEVYASGSVPLFYDDLLAPATQSLSADLLNKLQYDSSKYVPYSPDLLASWPAEIYSISVADASVQARETAHKSPKTQALISNSISLEGKIQDFQIEPPKVSVVSYKLVLLPIWVGSYTYQSKTYNVIINGQSGVVEGEVPRSAVQRFLGDILS